jgi:chromate transporter
LTAPERSALEVFRAFLKLGLTSFGGPIAHLGYFREEFVVRRRWVDDAAYTDLVALSQFLPGPSSSQVGLSLGLIRAGYWGGLAAWAGFTLPSAALMIAVAGGVSALSGSLGTGLLHGLNLIAVAIVAQAVCGMARSLCADRQRASIAGIAAVIIVFHSSALTQVGVILVGGLAGQWLCRAAAAPAAPSGSSATFGLRISRRAGLVALVAYALGLAVLPLLAALSPSTRLFSVFYRSGALVFGGGHVVLPLLRSAFVNPGWVSEQAFLAGYGAAQALPGPLFTFAAYLGAVAAPAPHRLVGSALGLIGIFVPGVLVLIGALPFWEELRAQVGAQASMRGVNAAVVGLLGATLYQPLWSTSVSSPLDLAVVLAAFILLVAWRTQPLVVVIVGAVAGFAFAR